MAAHNKNQAALGHGLEKNKPVEDPPRFALTEGQLQLLRKYHSLDSGLARNQMLRQLSGSSRANSLMMGMNSYWTPAFDNLQLRSPKFQSVSSLRGNRGHFSNRGAAWRPTQAYQPATMYDMNAPYPNEFLFPESMYDEYPEENSAPEPKRFIEFSDFIDTENFEDFGASRLNPLYDDDREPVEVEGEILYGYFGQCPRPYSRSQTMEPIHFWVNPYYAGTKVIGDWNSETYHISRTGVMIGGHFNLGCHSAMGVVIGYSDPVLTQYNARYTANDFHVGFYGGTYIRRIYELKGYLGFGLQDYTGRRTTDYGSAAGRTSGSSFAMSFELARPLDDDCGGLWKPYIALDLNSVRQDGYTEYGDAIAFRYTDASLTKTFFRLGLKREINRGNWQFRGGLAYSTQLGGRSAPASYERLVGTPHEITEYGVDTGRDFFHGNIGLEYFLNRCRTKSLFSDYNAGTSRRETGSLVTLGFKWVM